MATITPLVANKGLAMRLDTARLAAKHKPSFYKAAALPLSLGKTLNAFDTTIG